MDLCLENLLTLTERVLLHVEHGIPPEQESLQQLHQVIREMRDEGSSGVRSESWEESFFRGP
jgi:hypothetical protein